MKKAILYILLALCIAESTAVDLLCDQSDEKDDFNKYLVSFLLELIQGKRGLINVGTRCHMIISTMVRIPLDF